MRTIVIEGMDSSGKSTLAAKIASVLPLRIKESEGPPKSAEEINQRVARYNASSAGVLFVRHPVVSNPIYSLARGRPNEITPRNMDDFYRWVKPIFIYCDPLMRGLDDHVVKEHDSVEHLEQIRDNYFALLNEYRNWACRRAHLIYRIGDDVPAIVAATRAMCGEF